MGRMSLRGGGVRLKDEIFTICTINFSQRIHCYKLLFTAKVNAENFKERASECRRK